VKLLYGNESFNGIGAKKLSSIAFTGGGTAGHVFPGLAIAAELDERIIWIGSATGVEKNLVTEAGIEFRGIPAGKLRRYLSFRNLTDVLRIVAGVFASVRILRRERPALLFSKGGFVSVPPVVAAWLCGIPSWTHESDFDPGLATRINLRFCERVLVSLPDTVRYIPKRYQGKAVVTGNPVRGALYAANAARGRAFAGCPDGAPLVFVIGGSLGSAFINGLIAASRAFMPAEVFFIHQTGATEPAPRAEVNYFPAPFFNQELPDIMAAADIVISRAGANTLAELAALGKPSLLIPLPQTASRGDQLRNAEVFRAAGAAIVLPEEEARPESFARLVTDLLADGERRAVMGRCAAKLAAGRPARTIAGLIRERLA
jgi:UDP-N-acetylglucosamine--N-acetylmuramyl-(pentapeptide) pyrophosphoryl-undecaprenol N-acetylglucosamine transferase